MLLADQAAARGKIRSGSCPSTIWPMPPCKSWLRLVRAEAVACCAWEAPARMRKLRSWASDPRKSPVSTCTPTFAWAPAIATALNICAATWPSPRSPTTAYKNCRTAGSPCASSRPGEMATGAAKPRGAGVARVGPRPRRGTSHVVFTPYELIEKLIPLIPRPRRHLVRYHGILGPAAKDRAKVVPTPPAPPAPDATDAKQEGGDKAGNGEPRCPLFPNMPSSTPPLRPRSSRQLLVPGCTLRRRQSGRLLQSPHCALISWVYETSQ
jgi:hypothetical protein